MENDNRPENENQSKQKFNRDRKIKSSLKIKKYQKMKTRQKIKTNKKIETSGKSFLIILDYLFQHLLPFIKPSCIYFLTCDLKICLICWSDQIIFRSLENHDFGFQHSKENKVSPQFWTCECFEIF
jgi:hypothetical protein